MEFVDFAIEILPQLMEGARVTVQITAIAICLGLALGLVLALMRSFGGALARSLAGAYIAIIRGTPLLTQLFILYFGLPTIGISLSSFSAAIIGMGLNSAAYQAEYFRGAIQSIHGGQLTAARAIGMSRLQGIRHIIIPQTLIRALPSWSNELTYMVKYSSVAYMIQTPELMEAAKGISSETFRTLETYLVVALIYFVIVTALSFAMRFVEDRLRVPGL